MRKTVAIIQARMGSTRLPGKVLKEIVGKPILWHIIARVQQSTQIDEVVIATTNNKEDDELQKFLINTGVSFFRGSEDNVLERYYLAAKKYGATAIVRLTGDNPLVDPIIIDDTIRFFHNNSFRYVSDEKRTLPLGLGCEVFSFELLEEAYINASEGYEKEHVTPYMYFKQDSIGCYSINWNRELLNYRLTIDTIEDFECISEIYRQLYRGNHDFYLREIIKFIDAHPEITLINSAIKQKGVYE